MKLDQNKIALIVGLYAGLVHSAWAFLVWLGFAQKLLDWIFNLHFLNNPFNVLSFDLTTAATLTIVTFIVGYLLGWVFTLIWNKLER